MDIRRIAVATLLTVGAAVPCFAQADEPKLNQPSRPGAARSATIQRAGVLQLEFGVEGRLRSPELHSAQTLPVSLRYAVLQRLAVDLNVEPFVSQVEQEPRVRHSAFGDTVIGTQWVGRDQSRSLPAVALAYAVKVPTASEDTGTGRVDHRFTLLATRTVGAIDVDVNAAYLNVGREGTGRASGAVVAVSASQEFRSGLGYIGEWSHHTEEGELPRGGYALGAITYRVSEAARVDAAVRRGLTNAAPDVSVTAGLSISAPVHVRR